MKRRQWALAFAGSYLHGSGAALTALAAGASCGCAALVGAAAFSLLMGSFVLAAIANSPTRGGGA